MSMLLLPAELICTREGLTETLSPKHWPWQPSLLRAPGLVCPGVRVAATMGTAFTQ